MVAKNKSYLTEALKKLLEPSSLPDWNPTRPKPYFEDFPMGSLQHEVGGHPSVPSIPQKSFRDVLASSTTSPPPSSSTDPKPSESDPHRTGTHKGSPAIFFSPAHITQITKPFNWTLIGKFSQGYNKTNPSLGRPPVAELAIYFQALDLKRDVHLGLLDNRHVLIQTNHYEDFLRLYSRAVWYIKGKPLRIFKWTSSFHVDRESPITPVWVSFPRLPIHFFDQKTLLAIASLVGTPLRLDDSTRMLKRPSTGRVQIEIDLLQPHLDRIWIGIEQGDGFWQKLEYENVPAYCQHCWHVGHSDAQCTFQHPELKVSDAMKSGERLAPVPKQVYVPKGSAVVPAVPVSTNILELCNQNEAPISDVPGTGPVIETAPLANAVLQSGHSTETGEVKSNSAPVSQDAVFVQEEPAVVATEIAAPKSNTEQEPMAAAPPEVLLIPEEIPPANKGVLEVSQASDNVFSILPPQDVPPLSDVSLLRSQESITVPHRLNVDATAWHPKNPGISIQTTSFQLGRQLPTSFDSSFNFQAPDDDYGSWHTMNSAEEEVDEEFEEDVDEEEAMEEFLASRFVRDDLYLVKKQNRQSQSLRGRGRPRGSLNRTHSDMVHPMNTRSKTAD